VCIRERGREREKWPGSSQARHLNEVYGWESMRVEGSLCACMREGEIARLFTDEGNGRRASMCESAPSKGVA
jgi:hypothetical protein